MNEGDTDVVDYGHDEWAVDMYKNNFIKRNYETTPFYRDLESKRRIQVSESREIKQEMAKEIRKNLEQKDRIDHKIK